jgi:glutamyl-Q tRNA(Asp) synthetase
VDSSGKKISKSINPSSINSNKPNKILFNALDFLGQNPPKELITYEVKAILDWAIENWDINLLPDQKEITVNLEDASY